ncbi:MAG TPA: RHS repeat protein [Chloroflexi bacterium]|nr:RHS repeat protein [Chloroflexota bacterium]
MSIDIHGNPTVTTVTRDRATGTETRTTDFPDATTDAVEVSVEGLLVSSQSKTGATRSYAYDALGRRAHSTDPRTGTSVVQYNALGQVAWRDDAAQNRTTYGYDPATGRLVEETNALGHVVRYAYDDLGNVTHVWGDVPYPVRYVYDALGQRVEMHTFRNAEADWNTAVFPVDAGPADITRWHYDEATGLLVAKEDAAANAVTYTYGPGGKVATRDDGITTTRYTYNANNSLITVEPATPASGDTKVTFLYDYLGRRIRKVVSQYVSGAWTQIDETLFLYDGWNLVEERYADSTVKKSYVWGPDISGGLQGAGGIGGLVYATPTGS